MQIPAIASPFDASLAARLEARINDKTKPLGSLGALERLARQIGLIQGSDHPVLRRSAIVVCAGDHGVTAEGISAYPQSVTWQMVENFLAGGAAINIFARQNECALYIVDTGVNHDFGPRDGLLDRKIAPGTANFCQGPAMTAQQCQAALLAGLQFAESLQADVLGFGEMGIGNTTAAAALMAAFTGVPVQECVGAGTGLDAQGVARKADAVTRALRLHAQASAPLERLAALGGFEIAFMTGAMLGAAQRRKVILIDGFIVTSALLVAAALQPAVLEYCVFSHCSDEAGHRRMLQYLGATPLMQLDLRLGEGTGAALALPLLRAAVNFLERMATFSSASVSEKHA
ncbi:MULTISPECIES: nicotinate-nucleotide--dimethylbenzimidazole phosphoribosyltransferase [unclassified Herbaspirillum]|uniref:nicotinate-nucleotide--dimethylbenzimidazole phosphoribosyltransferase n=1 Tax=unclassified Herbaspirillum TaxID=2624150 RepID=UPI000C0A38EE|nr:MULTISPECIES: nicotinate-nucleotide--dimethylbenzimidazole phosphoribosyltransferase [unclassified Herbaspirillum]MAF01551.1 nicotinate-nucleotide--dimethylbenzimidazole phosphoribosyltransferase [Herbaspirillum sp.]MBO18430.1 nicotinate-nucleotide--dimethylbenzimidazole phosphoribosyltransferase [Herbaspirillum sp.]|tara:strand:+ start:1758 stop:2792 length:1035 start_codon:yes stop_codon:yes gene_type:complete